MYVLLFLFIYFLFFFGGGGGEIFQTSLIFIFLCALFITIIFDKPGKKNWFENF